MDGSVEEYECMGHDLVGEMAGRPGSSGGIGLPPGVDREVAPRAKGHDLDSDDDFAEVATPLPAPATKVSAGDAAGALPNPGLKSS